MVTGGFYYLLNRVYYTPCASSFTSYTSVIAREILAYCNSDTQIKDYKGYKDKRKGHALLY